MSDVLITPGKVQRKQNHTLITPSESDGLLFPGKLETEKSHTLISPLVPSYTNEYLKVGNALSELNTSELKDKARENLEINWGHIEGDITHQKDLITYLEENSQGVKLNLLEQLPENEEDLNQLISDKQLSVYEVKEDSYIDEGYHNYGRNEPFKVKAGDLLFTANYQNDEPITNFNLDSVPYITQDFNNKLVNLVFDTNEFEIGVVNNNVQTIYRQIDPIWKIEEVESGVYRIKHIQSGQYLQADGHNLNCSLTKEGSNFTIDVYSDGSCEICYGDDSFNMRGGDGINRAICLWTKGVSNRLHIIESSRYNLPKFSRTNSKTFYTIEFKSSELVLGLNEDKAVVHSDKESQQWALMGTHNKFQLLNKQLNKYLDYNNKFLIDYQGEYMALAPRGFDSRNYFEIALLFDLKYCINQHGGSKEGNPIGAFRRGDVNNLLSFTEKALKHKTVSVVVTNEATKEYSGLMSSQDKHNLDQLVDVDWIDII